MTSGGAESHVGGQEVRGGMPRSWNGILASPSMEEHFYPFISDRRSSYLAEDEEENGDEDLNLILERKDKDLLLAAELGKALLERNDQLMKERDSLEEELKESLDMLEQKKHAMRLKMEVRESEWRAQVTDLESDLAQARLQLQQLMSEQRECGKESANVVQELSEQNQRLLEQLAQTAQEEQSLNVELQSLRKENRELTFSRGQFAPCLQSLQIENTHLLEKKREMESQIKLLKDDNDSTQNQLGTAKETIYKLQMQNHELDTQTQELEREVQELRDSQRLLQLQVKELQEELHMRDSHLSLRGSHFSLHSEIQQSTAGQEHEMGRNSVETQSITSDYTDTYLTEREGDLLRESEEETVRLQDQVTMQYIELIALREEVKKLREITQQNNSDAHVKQAVIDRDEAIINRKGELELELAKCQMEKENMNLELLGAIRQKVMLRQELEAWQDDMQIVINQQLKAQRQEQAGRGPGAPSNSVQRQNSSRRQKDGGSIFSFFKNI